MASGTFFISWQLWEEMTFVLAMGIVAVFFAGLVKLWWTNRHMRKLEALDAEKQARLAQLRKSGGLPNAHQANGHGSGYGHGGRLLGCEIPFGIKALESGAEVEGIWVARMASMTSRPPDRKWSSKKKVRTPPASVLLEMNDLSRGPSKRARRGSSRASKISRREIVVPSSHTRGKLESLSLLEEERRSRDTAGRGSSSGEYASDGPARKPTSQGRAPQHGHRGPLGRIQRSIRNKVTSMDSHEAQMNKRRQSGESVRDFREQAEARKPQRFYPENTTTTRRVAPRSRDQVSRSRVDSLQNEDVIGRHGGCAGHGTDRAGPQPSGQPLPDLRHHIPQRQSSLNSSSSSVETFVTSSELPKEFSPVAHPPPLEQHPALAGGDETILQDHRPSGSRRSLRSTQYHVHRSSSEDSSSLLGEHDTAQSTLQTATIAHRYPPNSSRSATVTYSRPQSFTQHQQQQHKQNASASTQHSPTLGSSDSYVNVTKRKVNPNFEVLPAGTFAEASEQTYNPLPTEEPAGAAGSSRSSFDSQRSRRSGGRRKLQKKSRNNSVNSQYSR